MEIKEEVMRCTTCTVDEDCGMFLTHSQSKEMILDGIPVIMEEMESNKKKGKIETCMGPYLESKYSKQYLDKKDEKDYLKVGG